MTIPVTREVVSYGGPDGSLLKGVARQVISGQGATRTLLPGESGALCLFDRAAGIVYTLPAPTTQDIGCYFDFATTVTITSNAAKVITDAATTFLVGGVNVYIATSATTIGATANGTTIRAISSNGTTTGGVIGDAYRVTLVSSTLWQISGLLSGSGTVATPFATS
jgi:hypothetical protein